MKVSRQHVCCHRNLYFETYYLKTPYLEPENWKYGFFTRYLCALIIFILEIYKNSIKLCMTVIKWLTYANWDFQCEKSSIFLQVLEGEPAQLIKPSGEINFLWQWILKNITVKGVVSSIGRGSKLPNNSIKLFCCPNLPFMCWKPSYCLTVHVTCKPMWIIIRSTQ